MTSAEAFEKGRTFTAFLDSVEANSDLWWTLSDRVTLHHESVARIAAVAGQWRLLVLADDWCGDAVNILPVIAGLADAAPNLTLRILGREEVPEVMERHLTHGTRSIPVAILLDEKGEERGWWGPRPQVLQEWFEAVGRTLEKPDRYPALRRWYARDRGESTCKEIADLIWCGAYGGAEVYHGTRPCKGAQAA